MSSLASTSDGVPFQPGYLFAGRYRLVDRLGRGGLGDVWRADDLVLQTPVALRLVQATSPEGRARLLEEVRLARQITHPAVCRVFDVGEAQGGIYYSMELVEGDSLGTLLRRAGRFPFEKVVEIGYQLCSGLATAHAQGVLHRDLRPSNVLVDAEGSVRITNFGFAAPRDEREQSFSGAIHYMAPEQRTPGSPLSEKTDLYAVGVLLYELLVGARPHGHATRRSSAPPPPSTLVADVTPQLERVILQALEPDPRDRPASAAAMAASLVTMSPSWSRFAIQPWLAGGALAVVMGTLAVLAAWFLPSAPQALSEQDTIVLADFMNTTGEPVFDGALKVALAVALEQSPFLRVFPEDRARETLRRMQRAPDERVTRALGREIAQREQLKALVAGSIGTLGSHFVLALEAINAATGDVMAREQVEVAARELVLTALGSATARLREKLGESLASIERFDTPLPQATTPSLEALHAYSLALDQGRVNPRVEAIPHLKRAIELDPSFAMAQALLSGVYKDTGQSTEAPVFSRRAFELRNRVSERERFFISWRYFVDAAQAWDSALQLALSWTATYPREAFAFNSRGIAFGAFGQHEEAVRAFREAIRLDGKFVPPHGNLVGSLIALDRFAEAGALLNEGSQRGMAFISVRRRTYLLAFVANDAAAMTRELDLVRNSPDAKWASMLEAWTAAFSGRFQAAHMHFQRGVQAALRDNQRELGAQWTMEDAESHAIAGDCGAARREVQVGLELSRDNFTLERAARALALCGSGGEAARVSAELAERFPDATLTTRIQLPIAAAADALHRGAPERALELLDAVKPYDHAPSAEFWPAYLRGQAYLQRNDGPAATAQFESILQHRGESLSSPLYPLAHLGLARAAVMEGNIAEAHKFYDAFFALWSGADSTLQPVKQARAEYQQISGTSETSGRVEK
jgi:eukaryotic-like serine/threonine-protein kinase